jgi:hypothetical protein
MPKELTGKENCCFRRYIVQCWVYRRLTEKDICIGTALFQIHTTGGTQNGNERNIETGG